MQNGDVLVLVNPDPSEKWPLRRKQRFGGQIRPGYALKLLFAIKSAG